MTIGRKLRELGPDCTGAAMVEFALSFPLQLLFTLGIMQLSLLYIGHQVTTYAAFTAARTALTNDGNSTATSRAAQDVCQWIVASGGRGSFFLQQGARQKTRSRMLDRGDRTGEVVVEVSHDFELIIPVVNEIFAYPWKKFLWFGSDGGPGSGGFDAAGQAASRRYGSPHVTLKKIAGVPKPWKDMRSR
ncbi:MAG: pilus assembly protein [Planctomycetes bacterium]|nr:pilus assembly protein [Planctomycetota bacterium]